MFITNLLNIENLSKFILKVYKVHFGVLQPELPLPWTQQEPIQQA
jgi:hypothetical protein